MMFEMRDGTPTDEEARAFSELAMAAGGELFVATFGPKSKQILQQMYLQKGNYFSYELTAFLWSGDEILGMVNGYSIDEKEGWLGNTLREMARMGVWSFLGLIWRSVWLSSILSFLDQMDEGDFYISFVGVMPGARGQGFSQKLLSYANQRASGRGCEHLVLDVESGNASAIRAYEKWGMHVAKRSKVHKQGEASWQLLRMNTDIDCCSND